MRLLNFIRNWMLPIAMIFGVSVYCLYIQLPLPGAARAAASSIVSYLQPLLIFSMLFLTFCRIELHDLKPCKWHGWLLGIQVLAFSALSFFAMNITDTGIKALVEGAMLCFICPTATAAAVVVRKLGGNVANNTTYLILINLVTALVVPLFVPLIHPQVGVSFITAFALIIGKVFPLLLLPLIAAMLVRKLLPKLHAFLVKFPDLPFYMWSVALSLAMAMTAKTIYHTNIPIPYHFGIAAISLVCCFLQFYLGRKIGGLYGDKITCGQTLGQKNTVLAIWLGYTFFTPITAIAGGFYSIWHNIANSYQLYKKRKEENGQL